MFQQQLDHKSEFQKGAICLLGIVTIVWLVFGIVWLFPVKQVSMWLDTLAVDEAQATVVETAVSTNTATETVSNPLSTSPEILKSFEVPINSFQSQTVVHTGDKITKPNALSFEASNPPAPLENAQLIIPSLGLTHAITRVPIISGQWDISELGTQVGHLQSTGEAPNQTQAMTFIGHATVPWPGVGPFADLILVEHGEEIIYRWGGSDYVYEVSRILLVNPSSVESLYAPDGEMLILATCSNWDFIDREYDKRLVTQAKLVRVETSPIGD